MAHVTKIKAKDPNKPTPKEEKDKKVEQVTANAEPAKKVKKEKKKDKTNKKPFVLFRPFIAFGHYLRDSWREIRQVRWPNRKATWKMVFAVFVYTAIFVIVIMLLDALFAWLFNLILG